MARLPPSEEQLGIDEERTLLSDELEALADGGRDNLPTHVQHSDFKDVDLNSGNYVASTARAAWERFNGHGRKRIGFLRSVRAVICSSCTLIPIDVAFLDIYYFGRSDLNVMVVFIPLAWVSHVRQWGHKTTFGRMCYPWDSLIFY